MKTFVVFRLVRLNNLSMLFDHSELLKDLNVEITYRTLLQIEMEYVRGYDLLLELTWTVFCIKSTFQENQKTNKYMTNVNTKKC